jgi:hypothetical protein
MRNRERGTPTAAILADSGAGRAPAHPAARDFPYLISLAILCGRWAHDIGKRRVRAARAAGQLWNEGGQHRVGVTVEPAQVN